MTDYINPADEMKALEIQRSTLDKAIQIAKTVEKLHHGLQAVLLMGKPTASIPKHIMENLEELDQKTKLLPSSKLKDILDKLEQTVHEKLMNILDLAEKGEEQLPGSRTSEGESCDELLQDYLKKAQTAVALRVMLRARGEPTKPTSQVISTREIRERLTILDKRETKCRTVVKKETVTLIENTDRMLERNDLPDTMREMVAFTREDLQLNLDHLKAGKSLETLPVVFDTVAMEDDRKPIRRKIKKKKKKTITKSDHPVKKPEPPKQVAKPGFIRKIYRWITTPVSMGWNDIEDEIEEKYQKERIRKKIRKNQEENRQ